MQEELEDFRAYTTHMEAEHRRLAKCLCGIEQQWGPKGAPLKKAPPSVINSLKGWRRELANHFEEEEAGGCLEEAVAHLPSLGAVVTRLEHEHPELLAQLDHIIELLESKPESEKYVGEACQAFQLLAKRLRAHEAAENHILAESFGIEVT